jgi:deferrochelatase/peroxidase EfeB
MLVGNAQPATVADVNLADIQGNILLGYRWSHVRHLVVRVADAAAARTSLRAVVDGISPVQVTSTATWQKDGTPGDTLNVGITFAGLRALGVPERSLASFPIEFREGMVVRARKLGDIGPSAPEYWDTGLRDAERVHLILTIHADDSAVIESRSHELCESGAFEEVDHFDGAALSGGKVHFGYRDGIAQPRFLGIHNPDEFPDRQPFVPLGAVLLGHPTPFPGLRWRVPEPGNLGYNGTFNAFRILAQDVVAFERFLEEVAEDYHEYFTPELVAAKLCGRWSNGVPLQQSPYGRPPDPARRDRKLDDFDYVGDPSGAMCPIGAHIRRCNPRSSTIVQRGANHSRQIVRRGVPYGSEYKPGQPDDVPRGLLGNFLCASLAAQFEAVQSDWLNLGLHDPRISGSNDALSGANDPTTSRFEIPIDGKSSVVLQGFSSFVTTRGGAYTFLPSLTALRWIADL